MRPKNWIRFVASALVFAVLMALSISPAFAAEFRSEGSYVLRQGETVGDDLYASGGTITLDGTVNGDAILGAGTVVVNGPVSQSIMAAGGTVNVGGTAGDDIRIAGGNLVVSGSATHDILAAGGTFDLTESARSGGDLILGTGSARIAGDVGRNIQGSGGDVTILGTVGGNVDIDVDSLTIGPGARITGNLTYRSARVATVAPDAVISGEVTRLEPASRAQPTAAGSILGVIIDRLRYLVAPIVLGVILLLLAPRMLNYTSDTIRRHPWPSLGWGVLVLVVTPIAGLIVFIATLLLGGISITVAIFAIYILLLVLAVVFVATLLGKLILSSWQSDSRWWLFWSLVVGTVVLAILTALPWVGPWITLLVIIFGIGAIVTTGIGAMGRARAEGTV